ncbi:hypothetical protein BU17DRAFT_41801 [Hysterangium stoloniferum]|nr:hypothetical protein BU17DRAFT_41801 [Hysterangium stoloniferum]
MPGTSPGASSYSSLLTAAPSVAHEKQDVVNPFKYSKEEMLHVWKEGGGRGTLGLEVELWEGVVKESGGEPVGLKEMSDAEKKLFSLSINSELRRRQSHDFLPGSAERPKHPHSASSTHGSLGQSRYSAMLARKRKEDGTDTGPPLSVPRRLSLTSLASPLGTPLSPTGGGLPSPRTRLGNGPHGFDSPITAGDSSWRKRDPDPIRVGDTLTEECDEQTGTERDSSGVDPSGSFNSSDLSQSVSARSMAPSPPSFRDDSGGGGPDLEDLNTLGSNAYKSGISAARPPDIEDDPSNVNWSYRDPKGNIQGISVCLHQE